VAEGYIDRHGNVTWAEIKDSLDTNPGCYKLHGYWAFTGCRYHKGLQTCSNPNRFDDCPLPRHPLRNGRLNQTAYSLYLFIRDVAGGDFVGWIDQQLADHRGATNLAAARAALLDPLRNIHGISDKVLGMALATLLMGAGATRPGWFDVGASFIVVDTLVHNFLVRTGILDRLAASCLLSVNDGTAAIYLSDHFEAVCYVCRYGRLGWFLQQTKGPKNVEIEPSQLVEIHDAFASVGIHTSSVIEAIKNITLIRKWLGHNEVFDQEDIFDDIDLF
jgi:hypothetical protein